MWLSDFRLVLPDQVLERGSVRIEDGRIAEVIEGPSANPTVNGSGLTLIPGLIDLHGDMLEREIEPRPGVPFPVDLGLLELDKRMAGAGITTAFAALSFAWDPDDHKRSDAVTRNIIDTVYGMRDHLLIDTYVHARFEVTNAQVGSLLTELLDAGKIHLVSIMDHTPGQGQYKDIKKYVESISKWLGISTDDIDPKFLMDKIHARIARQQARQWSWEVVEDVLRIAKQRNVPVASHDDDTKAKVDRLATMGVSISEFPVTLEAAEAAKAHNMHVVMGAPNAHRAYSYSGNLSAIDAIKAGVVDTLAVDYLPASLLHASFDIANKGILPLHEAIKLVSQNPAEAVYLTDRGSIEVGKLADLVCVETEPHRRVRGTLRHGHPVFWDASMARRGTLSLIEQRQPPAY
jgi:alpha-D-ribose 1-methylphosphonate 5-triphosphate diphosphatase